MSVEKQNVSSNKPNQIERYYRFHSKIYDASRWSFLFGRRAIIRQIAQEGDPRKLLEIGCGTGKNLVALCEQFPDAKVTGLDLSRDMRDVAQKKVKGLNPPVELLHRAYNQPLAPEEPYDLILFSYALTMFNPGWEEAIENASADLAPGGLIAVVDFHDTPFGWFERWMGVNLVRMDGHLLPKLQTCFQPRQEEVRRAYGGLWRYFLFIGMKAQ